MKYFNVEYEYNTRPRFRKGRAKKEVVVFSADSLGEALRLAKADAQNRWHNRRWMIVSCSERP